MSDLGTIFEKERIVAAVRHACDEFGEYSYCDKGPTEVMDMNPYVRAAKEMDIEQLKALSTRLGEMYDQGPTLRNGIPLVNGFIEHLVLSLDVLEEEKFDAVLSDPRLDDIY